MRAIIVNPGTHPEPGHAAAVLAAHGDLLGYITASRLAHDSHMVALTQRWGGEHAGATLSPRVLPEPISRREVQTIGLPLEALFQVSLRAVPQIAPHVLRWRDDWFVWRTSRSLADKRRVDVVMAQQSIACRVLRTAPPTALRVLNHPIVHHRWISTYYEAEALENPTWRSALQLYHRSDAEMSELDREVELADLVLVGSSFAKRTFAEAGVPDSKVAVVSLGATRLGSIRLSDYEPTVRPLRVLFVGQVNQRKGISYLLEAIHELDGAVDLRLVGPISAEVRDLVGRHPFTTVVGPVAQVALLDHYEWSDVVALPSLVEGFGLAAIDAMVLGRGVIVSEHTLASDVVTHGVNGWVVPPRESAAIRGVLSQIVDGYWNPAEVGLSAAARAKAFTWESYGTRVRDTIAGALGHG